MPILSPLRAVATSAVALAVAATAGVVLAEMPHEPTVTYAVPAKVDPEVLAQFKAEQRQALITSRAQERQALAASAMLAVEQRNTALAQTVSQIDAAEKAEQERIAAEKKAAEKKAAEKKAAEKKAAEKKAAEKPAVKPAPAVGGGTPAQNRELGRQLAQQLYGWGGDQFACYDNIIMRESRWIHTAKNPSSSAYGIPQALPGSKMATAGSDWRTNPATQIRWGLKYVKDRYGSPCKAWSFWQSRHWY